MVSDYKKTQVDNLTTSLQDKANFLLVKIDRTTHQNLEKLRRALRKTGSTIKVIKNTYFEKAVNRLTSKEKVFKDLKKSYLPMKDSSAMVFLDKSWDTGLKAFWDFAKEDKTLSFKLSLLDNSLYNPEETEKIAKLPGRLELLAKIIGSMKSPLSKFVYASKFNTNKFVYILQTKAKEVKS